MQYSKDLSDLFGSKAFENAFVFLQSYTKNELNSICICSKNFKLSKSL